MSRVDHIRGETFHGRRGGIENAFRYSVDYVMLDAERAVDAPSLFRRNAAGLVSLHDADHGGAPEQGRGAVWARKVLADHGIDHVATGRILLLAQPRVLGHVFNPVSFWLVEDDAARLRIVIAEVSNTFGDRHSYMCHRDDLEPIERTDTLSTQKVLHVSPFQKVEGGYSFRYDIRPDRIGIWIDFRAGNRGLYATLVGPRVPLTNRGILSACIRRPFGSRRVLGLIHWQAVKLWWKGAGIQSRPTPPAREVSR